MLDAGLRVVPCSDDPGMFPTTLADEYRLAAGPIGATAAQLRAMALTGAEASWLPADEKDSISHLLAVVRGARKPNALSSLENNLIATEILEAARESARTHQRVILAPAR